MGRISPIGVNYKSLLLDWNYPITPISIPLEDLGSSSSVLVHWKCHKCGYEWDDTVNNRARQGRKCPICSRSKKFIKVGYNDLATLRPDLLKDWDYNKNTKKPTELRVSSHYQAYWKCHKCGHEWCSRLDTRTKNGSGCPICNVGGGCSVADYFLFLCVSEFYNDTSYRKNVNGYELDVVINNLNIGIEFDGFAYHNIEKDMLKDAYMKELGYTVYHIRERKDEQTFFTIDNVEDVLYVSHVCATTLSLYKDAVFNFLKYLGLVKESIEMPNLLKEVSYNDILTKIHTVPYKKSVKARDESNSYCLRWDYSKNNIAPDKLYYSDSSKRYFKCNLNHSVLMRVSSVYIERYGCPVCSGATKVKGINYLYDTAYTASLLLNNLQGYKGIREWQTANMFTLYTCPVCGKKTNVSISSILNPAYATRSICDCSPDVDTLEISILGQWSAKEYVYFAVQADGGTIFLLMDYVYNIRHYFNINTENIPEIEEEEFSRLVLYKCCPISLSRYYLVPYSLFNGYKHRNIYIEKNLSYAIDLLIYQRKLYIKYKDN